MTRSEREKIGILGAGSLAGFLLEGLLSGNPEHDILLSPRGRAKTLAEEHDVPVAASNQDLVDRCGVIFVCLPAATAFGILQELQFQPDQTILSAVARLRWPDLAEAITPADAFCIMMPGHANALRVGPSILYPPSEPLETLLETLGPVHALADQRAFEVASTFGAFSGASFVFMQYLIDWYSAQGIAPATARALIAETLRGNATVLRESAQPLEEIVEGIATPGGITRQCVDHLNANKGFESWTRALEDLLP